MACLYLSFAIACGKSTPIREGCGASGAPASSLHGTKTRSPHDKVLSEGLVCGFAPALGASSTSVSGGMSDTDLPEVFSSFSRFLHFERSNNHAASKRI